MFDLVEFKILKIKSQYANKIKNIIKTPGAALGLRVNENTAEEKYYLIIDEIEKMDKEIKHWKYNNAAAKRERDDVRDNR